jgi:SulP family sulfate permease
MRANLTSNIKGDITGALTTVMVSLPGNIVYGIIAFAPLGEQYFGLGILAGMFSSIFAGFFASLFGGTPIMVSGPQSSGAILFAAILTNLLATDAFNIQLEPDALTVAMLAFTAVFAAGIFQLVFGALRLGGLVKYISYPVITGIINGTAILMIIGQVSVCLGLPKQSFSSVFGNLGDLQPATLAIALIAMLVMWKGNKLIPQIPGAILSIIVGTLLYFGVKYLFPQIPIGPDIGDVPNGSPSLKFLTLAATSLPDYMSWKFLWIIINGGFALAVISSLNSLLSTATLQNITNQRSNANRELIGQGLGNVAASFFGGITGQGFVGRSTANYNAGGRTKLSALLTSVFLLLVIMLFAQWIGYIPQVVMASVIIVLGIAILDPWSWQLVKDVFDKNVVHRGSLVTNLIVVLLVMIIAIFIDFMLAVGVGIVVSIALFVKDMSTSVVKHIYRGSFLRSKKIRHEELTALLKDHGDEIAIIELSGSIFFGATDMLMDKIDEVIDQGAKYILLDFKRVNLIDATGYKMFGQTYFRLQKRGILLCFSYFSEDSKFWTAILDFGLNKKVDASSFYPDTDHALEAMEDKLLKKLKSGLDDIEEMSFRDFFLSWDFLDEEIAIILDFVEKTDYPKGSILFSAGDKGDAMFFLAKGVADIFINLPGTQRQKRIFTMAYGTVFGEMALLDEKPRSATVIAATDLLCYRLKTKEFNHLKKSNPEIAMKFYIRLSKLLVNRLREANLLISEMEE